MNINFIINKYKYKCESEFLKFQSIKISLASPKKIKQWTQINSNFMIDKYNKSKILNPKTFNYKTLKPEKGGLFCETIFGSLKNLSSRRYKLGYIELIFPVTHIWYLKGSISYISIILNLKKKKLESIVYCFQFLSTQIKSFKHNLNYINFSSILKSNLIYNESIFNLFIVKSNFNFIASFDYKFCFFLPNLKKQNYFESKNIIIKKSNFISLIYKNKFNLKKKKINRFLKFSRLNKIKNKLIGLNKDWVNNIKVKNEPIILLRLSNPINLIFHNKTKNNFKFNNLLLKKKFRNIILKKNTYSIDFPILLFINNKIFQKIILNKKKDSFFITYSNLFKMNNNNFLNKKSTIIESELKNINFIYNTKTNQKTYFTNINIFVNFFKLQELPFKIIQSGYVFFNINKQNLKINENILNNLFFYFNKNKKINYLNFSEINFKFKIYKSYLEIFFWLVYLNNKEENFNYINYKKLIHLYSSSTQKNYNCSYIKKNYKKNITTKKIKYISNILSHFYEKYPQFRRNNFIKNNYSFKIKKIKKFNIKEFYIKLINIKNKIKYYNINTINNLILLEKYYNQDEDNINTIINKKKFKINLKTNYSNDLLNVITFKLILKKYNINYTFLKKINNINKKSIFKINEYCFSLVRFQNILKNLHSNFNLLIKSKSRIKNNNIKDQIKSKFNKNILLTKKNKIKQNELLFYINNKRLNKLKNIEYIFLLLQFEKNLQDEKICLLDLKLKNKFKTEIKKQFFLDKEEKTSIFKSFNLNEKKIEVFKVYFIPRIFKIHKKLLNNNNLNMYFNYKYLYNNNTQSFLKNPLGNNKFRKFITYILFTTIQKSLIICKIKLLKKILIKKLYNLSLYNEKKQLILFFFNNYGQLTELIGFIPMFNSSNYISPFTSNIKKKITLNKIENNKENNFLKNRKFFNLYDLEEKNIINVPIQYPIWLNKLNNSLNFFSYILLDKKYLIILQKETKNFDLKICLNILQKNFKYLIKNYKNNKNFNERLFGLNEKKQNYKTKKLLLNLNENLINNNFSISKNKIFQKIISFFGIYENFFINFYCKISKDKKDKKIKKFEQNYFKEKNLYKNIKLLNRLKIDNKFSIIYIDIKNIIWNYKFKESLFKNHIIYENKYFTYEQYIYIDNIKYILNNFSNNLESIKFNKLLENFILKNQLLLNKYYIISQFFLWNTQTDWETFLFYMSQNVFINDKIITYYVDRSISMDQPKIGAIAIKNILKNFNNNFFPLKIEKKKNIKLKYYRYFNMYNIFNNKKKIISIELLINNIKEKIISFNKQIKYYEDFLKFRIFFNKSESKSQFEKKNMLNFKKYNSYYQSSKYIFKLKKYNKFIKIFRKLETLRLLRSNLFRRLKLLQPFLKQEIKVEWMVLDIIPVLPPDLRPILVLDSQQVAVSDLNKLYQKVIFRNERLKRLSRDFYSLNISPEMRYAQRLLQESVDALIENGKADSKIFTSSNKRPLKSLSDMVKGKKGRFRQNLLGKRVDYSGRSVIVVGPNLKLYECGLPQEMAIELFQPFLIRQLLLKKFAKNFINAKKLIKNKSKIIYVILNFIMENRPILLNRAPTLHRLGIQAFKPKKVSGRAILLHPLVCSAFNADFDGDQMAVHIPIFYEACSESWRLLCSRNNILSPATGDPIIVPSQDMVLGSYYLTTLDTIKRIQIINYFNINLFLTFNNIMEIFELFNQQILELHTLIWLKYNKKIEFNLSNQYCLEIQVDFFGNISKVYPEYKIYYNWLFKKSLSYIKTTAGRVLINKFIFEIVNKH